MKMVAEHLEVHHGPEQLPVDVELGSCGIALTTAPFALMLPNTFCYAIVASWLPRTRPVGMFITWRRYRPAGRAEPALEVHTVFAVEEMRGRPNADGRTIPVAIGKWMFDEGLLTLHSPDRTDGGERWVRQVGGELPARDQVGTEADAARTGHMAIARLNQEIWPPPPWPPPTTDQ